MEREKLLGQWKKVYLRDLNYVVGEMRDMIATPCMVLLEGEMGAGKTTLLKSFFPQIPVNGPSYTILSEMGGVVHGDLDRVEREADLLHLELPLYLDKKDYFFVEWGKKFYRQLCRQIDPEWAIYQVQIAVNDSTEQPSRDYRLGQMLD